MLAGGDRRVCLVLGGCELVSRAGEARELVLQRAGAGSQLGREAAICEGGALELVDPGEHRGERPGAEDDRYRVGVALDVEAPQEGRDPRVRRGERATDHCDVPSRSREHRVERLPASFESRRRGSGSGQRGLGGEELELGRALRRGERREAPAGIGRAGRAARRESEEENGRARHEISRTPAHRIGDRSRRITAVCRHFRDG